MFLVTTPLPEYQDPADDLLYLGAWCLPGTERQKIRRKKECRVLPFLWKEPATRRSAYRFCNDFYEKVIPALAELLNGIHETNLSLRYWKIIAGPWLLFYTHVLYDRYRCVDWAFKEYPDLRTAGIPPASFWTPYDWHQYTTGVTNDYYNLQLYCQVMDGLGIFYETWDDTSWRKGLERSMDASYYLAFQSKVPTWKQVLHKGGARLFTGKNRRVVVSSLFNNYINHYRLSAVSGFRVGILPRADRDLAEIKRVNKPALDRRRALETLGVACTDEMFARVFVRSLVHNFPTCYLEDFKRRRQIACRGYGTIKVLASAYGWISDENFKFVAAEAAERKACLIGSQHGGNNGIERDILFEKHITDVVDKYYTYGGWGATGTIFSHAIAGTALEFNPHYTNQKRDVAASEQLLFVGTSSPRYLTQFRSGIYYSQFRDYQQWQIRFLESLPQEIRQNFLFRLRDSVWGSVGILSQNFKGLKFDDYAVSFERRVLESRVVVIDNLNTTFTQTLLMNRPVILYFDPRYTDIYEAAHPVLDNLQQAGILHHSPESAARKLATIIEFPDEWWSSAVTQGARHKFIDLFAVAPGTENWLGQWCSLLT